MISAIDIAYLYSSLLLDPKDVDPNVHPTKREVHFLNEEAIIETISDHIQGALAKQSSSKTYETQVSYHVSRGGMAKDFSDPLDRWNIRHVFKETKQ